MPHLSREDRAFFKENGYVVALPPAEDPLGAASQARQHLERVL